MGNTILKIIAYRQETKILLHTALICYSTNTPQRGRKSCHQSPKKLGTHSEMISQKWARPVCYQPYRHRVYIFGFVFMTRMIQICHMDYGHNICRCYGVVSWHITKQNLVDACNRNIEFTYWEATRSMYTEHRNVIYVELYTKYTWVYNQCKIPYCPIKVQQDNIRWLTIHPRYILYVMYSKTTLHTVT